MNKVLVVEDNLELKKRICDYLEELEYEYMSAANSESALGLFVQDNPDLVILDIELENSKLDGLEIANRIRDLSKVPIIIYSSLTNEKHIERIKNISYDAILTKPFSFNQFYLLIELVLRKIDKEPDNRKYRDYIAIKSKEGFSRIYLNEIFYIKADGNYSIIQTVKRKVLVTKRIGNILNQVDEDKIQRINRSIAVNFDRIISVDENTVYFEGDESKTNIILSRSSIRKLKKMMIT